MLPEQPKPIKLAYLYHINEQNIYETLHKHLGTLEREGLIERLPEPLGGVSLEESMKYRLGQARIILLLTSIDFDNDFSNSETTGLLKNIREKGTYVWPIIAKKFSWEKSHFHKQYGVFFGEDKQIASSWPSSEEPYTRIVKQAEHEIVQILSQEWTQYSATCYSRNYLQEALAGYNKSNNYIAGYPPALLGKLQVFLKLGKSEEAERCFQDIVLPNIASSTGKQDFAHDCVKGYALLEMGRLLEAQKAFQEVYQKFSLPINDAQRNICADAYYGEGDVCLKLATQTSNNPTYYYNQALTAYRNAEKFSSGYPKYLIGIGKTYLALGKLSRSDDYYKNALDIYEQIIPDYPNDVPAYLGKGEALYGLRHFQEALNIYDKARQTNQDDVEVYGSAGYALLELSRYKEALSAFNKVLSFNSKNGYYLYGKGQAQAGLELYQDALSTYHEAIISGYTLSDLFVDQAEALLNLADSEYISGHHAKAKKHYSESIDSYGCAVEQGWREYYPYYYGLGRAFFGSNDWTNASAWYGKAITLKPNVADAYLGIGKTSVELGSYEDAWNYLALAQSLSRNAESTIGESEVMNTYGNAYYRAAGKPNSENYYKYQKKACKCYERAIIIHPNEESFIGLGKASMAINHYEEAIDAFDQVLTLNPHIAECSFLKGQCYYNLGKYSDACIQYELVVKSDIDSISVYYDLGNALLAMKNFFDAMDAFNMEIKRAGGNTKHAYCGKGTALYALERTEEALQNFNKANDLDPLLCSSRRYRDILENIKYSIEGELRVNLRNATIYRQKGDVLRLLGGQNEDVIDAYTLAIEDDDLSAEVYYYRGRAYYALQDYVSSLNDYKEALRLDPNYQKAQQGKKETESMIVPKQKGFFEKLLKLWK